MIETRINLLLTTAKAIKLVLSTGLTVIYPLSVLLDSRR